jgi:hypothetical protein
MTEPEDQFDPAEGDMGQAIAEVRLPGFTSTSRPGKVAVSIRIPSSPNRCAGMNTLSDARELTGPRAPGECRGFCGEGQLAAATQRDSW